MQATQALDLEDEFVEGEYVSDVQVRGCSVVVFFFFACSPPYLFICAWGRGPCIVMNLFPYSSYHFN